MSLVVERYKPLSTYIIIYWCTRLLKQETAQRSYVYSFTVVIIIIRDFHLLWNTTGFYINKIIYESKYYDCNNNNERGYFSFLTRTTKDFDLYDK